MRFLKSLLPFSLINFIVLFCITLTLPETIPNHTNIKMEIDGYGSRWIVVILGAVPVLISFGIWIYWTLTKNNEKIIKNRKAEEILLPIIAALMLVVSWAPVFMATSYDRINRLLNADLFYSGLGFVLGLFMIIISNFMGIIKQNRYLGIRTYWTLKDETVWKKTHRLGGFTGVVGGVIMCVFSVAGLAFGHYLTIIGLFGGIVLLAFVPIVYSYVVYRRMRG